MWKSDIRIYPLMGSLLLIGLFVISSMTQKESGEIVFWTEMTKSQMRWIVLGSALFFLTSRLDYRSLRPLAPFLYLFILLSLVGLFFTPAIQHVHRWYKIPFLHIAFQPSEHAKLIVILFMAYLLEKREEIAGRMSTALLSLFAVGVPFFFIVKQPDLGTALILLAIGLTMGFAAGLHRVAIRLATAGSAFILGVTMFVFSGTLSHEEMRPLFSKVMKEYQYERLSPDNYHQRTACGAIAMGGVYGTGWHESAFSAMKKLPAAHTDSVFAAFAEEFGLVGVIILLFLFYGLIYCSFQVTQVARDPFGRYLAAGLSAYLATHVLVNVMMMCALLPLSGVPLIFITYGGNSLLTSMTVMGILQSIYRRRFMFA